MGREGRNVIHLGHTDVSFPAGPPLLWKGTEDTLFLFFPSLFLFFFSSTITEHVLAKRVYHTDV